MIFPALLWSKLFYLNQFYNSIEKTSLPVVLQNAFEWIRLGPSAGNKQPWRLIYVPKENRVDFFIDRRGTKKNSLYWKT